MGDRNQVSKKTQPRGTGMFPVIPTNRSTLLLLRIVDPIRNKKDIATGKGRPKKNKQKLIVDTYA